MVLNILKIKGTIQTWKKGTIEIWNNTPFSTFTQTLFYVMEDNKIAYYLNDPDLWQNGPGQNGNGFWSSLSSQGSFFLLSIDTTPNSGPKSLDFMMSSMIVTN